MASTSEMITQLPIGNPAQAGDVVYVVRGDVDYQVTAQYIANLAPLPTIAYANLTGLPTLAATLAKIAHQWLDSYNSTTGVFTQSQPSFSDISGTASAAQYVAMVGDSGSGGVQGAVPAPGSGAAAAGKFLRADGTWAVPSGSGSGISSVGLSTTASWLTVGSSPLTANGTLTLNPTAGLTQNFVLATPNGSAGALSPRALVAADLPAIAQSGVTGLTAALAALAPLASPTFTGSPVVPGYVPTTTTVNGNALTGNVVISASQITTGTLPHAQLPTLVSGDIPNNGANTTGTAAGLSAAIAQSLVTGLTASLAALAPLASPAFTGVPTAPTATVGTNTTQLATTAFVAAAVGASSSGLADPGSNGIVKRTSLGITTVAVAADINSTLGYTAANAATVAPLASPTFTGTVTIPTGASIAGFATLASPTFTGTPAAPTATPGTNTTQLATTAFVTAALSGAALPSGLPNLVVATNPTGSSSATAALRALVAADLPSVPQSGVTGLTASLALLAPLASPTFTGTPVVPGYVPTTTTVNGNALSGNVVVSASQITTGTLPHAQLPTLVSGDIPNNAANTTGTAAGLSAAIAQSLVTGLTTSLAALAPLASPALTGTPTVPTATAGTNTTQAASTAFVTTAVAGISALIPPTAISTTSTISASVLYGQVTAGSGGVNLTLQSTSLSNGQKVRFKKTDSAAGVVTFVDSNGALFEGQVNYKLINQWQWVEFVWDGTQYTAFGN